MHIAVLKRDFDHVTLSYTLRPHTALWHHVSAKQRNHTNLIIHSESVHFNSCQFVLHKAPFSLTTQTKATHPRNYKFHSFNI